MGVGLLISALVNLIMGFTNTFLFFALCWGVNGWVQSMGAPSLWLEYLDGLTVKSEEVSMVFGVQVIILEKP